MKTVLIALAVSIFVGAAYSSITSNPQNTAFYRPVGSPPGPVVPDCPVAAGKTCQS